MFHVKHFCKRKSPRWGLLGEGFLFHEGGGAGVLGRGGALLMDDDKHPGIPAGDGIAMDDLYPAAQLGDGALGRGKLLFPEIFRLCLIVPVIALCCKDRSRKSGISAYRTCSLWLLQWSY